MQITVKTLKGAKFTVEAEPINTIAQVKDIIEAGNKELPAASMKLIHSGKVLKDDQKVEECNFKPNDFLVVMITKAKKPAAAPPAAAAPAVAVAEAESTTPAPEPAAAVIETPAALAKDSAPTTTTSAPPAAVAAATPSSAPDEFPTEVIDNLTSMGFPEAEAKACLRAARGNPDLAVEFLMNGIPPGMEEGGNPLDQLRNHPQFNSLKQLVQTNPSMLQAVLTQIGQQQPELLRAINQNQAAFLEMMNEPITDTTTTAAAPPASSSAASPAAGTSAANMLAGLADSAQMAQLLSNLNPTELNEMASMMGLTPQQLQATAQMIGSMPPEQLQDFMVQAMQQGGGAGEESMIRLTPDEQASVDRLVDMGFDRVEATRAYLACDKNEAMAANLLMDGWRFGDEAINEDIGDDGGDGDDMYD